MPSASRRVCRSPALIVDRSPPRCCRSRAWRPNPYILSAGIVVLNYAVLSTSWNFVGGFTGYISLGHGALAGLGGYGTGLLVVEGRAAQLRGAGRWPRCWSRRSRCPIGLAALRVRGASFVIVSIALVLILLLVFQSWASFTGGSRGLVVPRPFPACCGPSTTGSSTSCSSRCSPWPCWRGG